MQANIPLSDDIYYLSKIFRENGYFLYLVGGAIRDWLMGIKPKDFDVATNAIPLQVEQILNKNGVYTFPKGESFGVSVAHIDGIDYEIATFREDIGIADGRHPESVKWSTPEIDAKRRDLTMNALFYEIPDSKNKEGTILDFFNGQAIEDVKNRYVRVVGDPFERFKEDRLRILRLIRFHCRFSDESLKIDNRTFEAISYYSQLRDSFKGLGPVSGERIQMEFESGFNKCVNVNSYLNVYNTLNLLEVVFPELSIDKDFASERNLVVVLAYLFRNNDANLVKKKLNEYKWPSVTIDEIVFLLKAYFALKNLNDIIYFCGLINKNEDRRENARLFGLLCGEKEFSRWSHFVKYRQKVYSGDYVMKLFNVQPGPEIGIIQRRLWTEDYTKSFNGIKHECTREDEKSPN